MKVDFDRSLPMMLIRALDAVMPSYREIYALHDLTDQQWRILRVLWQDGPASAADISRRTLLPVQSLVGILDRLEAKKLISRARSETDRRQIIIIATEKSMALKTEVMPLVSELHQAQKDSVSQQDWEKLLSILDEVTEKLKRKKTKRIKPLEDVEL